MSATSTPTSFACWPVVASGPPTATSAVVISRAMAHRYWPGARENAVSRELRLSEDGEPYHVVGVADDYKVDTPGEVPKAYLHLPLSREETYVNYVVCTFVAALGLVPALQREILVLDPELVLLDKGTVRDLADIRLCPVRAEAWLIGAFGVLALLVAGVGLAAVGGVIGAGLAAAARVMSSVLFVGAFDLVSFAVAFGVLALVAKLVPARRAGGGWMRWWRSGGAEGRRDRRVAARGGGVVPPGGVGPRASKDRLAQKAGFTVLA